MFVNGLGDRGSVPGRVIPKTQKMVFDAALLNTQHYKVRIYSKVEQSRERGSALPYTSMYDFRICNKKIKHGQRGKAINSLNEPQENKN